MRKRLKAERIRMRLTQAEMAEYLGITQASYSTIECGIRSDRAWIWEKLERLTRIDKEKLKENGRDSNGVRSVGRHV